MPYYGRQDLVNKKNPMAPIGNRTRDPPDCSAVPQAAAPPRCNKKSLTLIKEFRLSSCS